MKFLLVGLGNIGIEYQYTRHNIGFLTLDLLANKYQATWQEKRYASVTEFRIKNKKVTAIKPTTYMNLSGKAYKYWLQELQVPIDKSLVVVDDISLDFGALRIKLKGSAGGHNGLTNIQEELQTESYPRMRMGIGKDFPPGGQIDYVLGRWNEQETQALPAFLHRAVDAIESCVLSGFTNAMNVYNTKS